MNLQEEDQSCHNHEIGEDAHSAHGAADCEVESGSQGATRIVLNHRPLEGSGFRGIASLTNDHTVGIHLSMRYAKD